MKALQKEFWMEIRKSKARFLSIFTIVALGVAFFSGIQASSPDMRHSGDAYYDEKNLMDLKVVGTLGLTEEDVEALCGVSGVETAEGAWSVDVICGDDENQKVLHMESLNQTVNQLTVTDGRLPENSGELFLDSEFAENTGYEIGDVLSLREDADSGLLKKDTYTIVGIGDSPLYISLNRGNSTLGTGEVNGFAYILPEDFDQEVYTQIYILIHGAQGLTSYTDGYDNLIEKITERVEGIQDVRCQARYGQIKSEAQEELDEAEQELADGKKEAEKELAEAEAELQDGEAELADGRKEYEDGVQELADARKELADGEQQLTDARKEISDGWAQTESAQSQLGENQSRLKSAQTEVTAGWEEVNKNQATLDKSAKKLESAREEYNAGKEQLEAARITLDQQQTELDSSAVQIAQGRTQIETTRTDLNTKRQQCVDGLAEVTAGEEQLAAAEVSLAQAREQLAALTAQRDALKAQYEAAVASQAVASGVMSEEELAALAAQLAALEEQTAAVQGQVDQAAAEVETNRQTLSATRSQLESSIAEIDAGLSQLTLQENELTAAEQEIAGGRTQLEEARKELEKQETKLQSAQKELQEGENELEAGQAELDQAKAELEAAQAEVDAGLLQLAQAQEEINNGISELNAGEQEILENEQKLQDARQEIEDGEKDLAEAEQELQDAEAELSDGWKEYGDARKEAEEEIAENEQKLLDAREELEELEEPEWIISSRNDLPEYADYGDNAERIQNIGRVFPVIFFLVAALISLTTMTRMVEEQRTQIGTMKALGYSKGAIASKYLCYALLATVGGSVLGILIGQKTIPYVIITAYGIMYHSVSQRMVLNYELSYAMIASVAAVVCTVGATLFSCVKELRETPASLMRPPAPKDGKRVLVERITFLWKHLSFSWKSTLRNLFRYKKRLFMTIFGISGSMALLLVGFGLQDSISGIARLQFEELHHYEGNVIEDGDAAQEEKNALLELMEGNEKIERCSRVQMTKMEADREGSSLSVYVFVPESLENFREDITLQDRVTKEKYELSDRGAAICEKTADILGLEKGDSIVLKQGTETYTVTVDIITENYMSHYVYMTPEVYEETFGREPEYENILFTMKEEYRDDMEAVGQEVLTCEAALSISYTSSLYGQLERMLSTLDVVIIVLIVSAGMLAFVVLYNLNNINITERKRELATLKVLGFFDGEVSQYVFRENILLTLIGLGVGAALGILLHQYVITTVEVDAVMFGRTLRLRSFLYGMLFTCGFSLFVNLTMHFKLKKIDMVESLKSVE